MANVPTVMIVEDEESLRDNIRMFFEEHHCRVLVATCVDDALSLLTTETPDIILLDLLLPDKLGTFLLESLKEQGCTIPVIVVTNTDSVGRREECMGLGAKDYIIKSNISLSNLLALTLQHLIGSQRLGDDQKKI